MRKMKSGFQIVYATCQTLYRFTAHPPKISFAHKWCGKNRLPLFPPMTHLLYRMMSFIKNNKIPPRLTLPIKQNNCVFSIILHELNEYTLHTENLNFKFLKSTNLYPVKAKLQSSLSEDYPHSPASVQNIIFSKNRYQDQKLALPQLRLFSRSYKKTLQ